MGPGPRYGSGPRARTRPGETTSKGSPGRAAAPSDRDREIQALKQKVRTIEARLRHLNDRIGGVEPGFRPSELRAYVDPERCVGCGTCEEVCPLGAISVEEVARVDQNRCIGCGTCVAQCPRGAIELKSLP